MKELQKDKKKKISLKTSINKIVDVVKKPFLNIKQQLNEQCDNKQSISQNIDDIIAENNDEYNEFMSSKASIEANIQNDVDNLASNDTTDSKHKSDKNDSSLASNPAMNFFYTNDKFIAQFEDDDIIATIQEKFPMFKSQDADDTILRKTIIEMLNDTPFMTKTLKHYDITIFDFFKFLFRVEPSIFRGQFLKRIQKALKYKKYVIAAKKQAYRYSPKRNRKRKARRR